MATKKLTAREIDALCDRALKVFGTENEVDKAVEECSELAAALIRWKHGRDGARSQATSECADVIIMMRQMRKMLGERAVDSELRFKAERLDRRIDESESNRKLDDE